jgi:hypothetical protein
MELVVLPLQLPTAKGLLLKKRKKKKLSSETLLPSQSTVARVKALAP